MPPISLTPEQRRALFDQIGVTPIRPDQTPTNQQIDQYLQQAPKGDPLALLLQNTSNSVKGGIGSVAGHTTPPTKSQINDPVGIKVSGVSGELVINERDHKTHCQLLSFSGLTFLVTRVPTSEARKAEIRFWPLNHLDHPNEFNRFTDLFPAAGCQKTLGTNSLATFVSLKRTLTGSVKKEDLSTPKQPGYLEMMFSIRGAHFGLKVASNNPDDIKLTLPGGASAATLLGVTLEKTDDATLQPEDDTAFHVKKIPDDAKGISEAATRPAKVEPTEEPVESNSNNPNVRTYTLESIKQIKTNLFDITIFQAGPFVVVYNKNTNAFEMYYKQTEAKKVVKYFLDLKEALANIGSKKTLAIDRDNEFDDSLLILVPKGVNEFTPVSDLAKNESKKYDDIRDGEGLSNLSQSANFPKQSIKITRQKSGWQLEVRESDEVKKIFNGAFAENSTDALAQVKSTDLDTLKDQKTPSQEWANGLPLFSAAWFAAIPENHPGFFKLTDQGGRTYPGIVFETPDWVNIAMNKQNLSLVCFVYFDIASGKARLFIQPAKRTSVTPLIIKAINQARALANKTIQNPLIHELISSHYYPLEIPEDDDAFDGPMLNFVLGTKIAKKQNTLHVDLIKMEQKIPQDQEGFSFDLVPAKSKQEKKEGKKRSTIFTKEWFEGLDLDNPNTLFIAEQKALPLFGVAIHDIAFLLDERPFFGGTESPPHFLVPSPEAIEEKESLKQLREIIDKGLARNNPSMIAAHSMMGIYKLCWQDVNEPSKRHEVSFIATPLAPRMTLATSNFETGQQLDAGTWTIKKETITSENQKNRRYYLSPPQIQTLTPNTVDVPDLAKPEKPKLSTRFKDVLEEINQINEARRGIKHLPLDFKNWATRNFTALTNPFQLEINVQLERDGKIITPIGSVRDFKRHTTQRDNAKYTFKIKWGNQSDFVTYAIEPAGDNFILKPISSFDYADPVTLGFVKKADGSYESYLNINPQSRLFEFLDSSLYAEQLTIDAEDISETEVRLRISGTQTATSHLMDEVITLLAPLFRTSKQDIVTSDKNNWTLSINVDQAKVAATVTALNKIKEKYSEQVHQKREPKWKSPKLIASPATKQEVTITPTKTIEKTFEFDLSTGITIMVTTTVTVSDTGSTFQINRIIIPALPSYRIWLNDEPYNSKSAAVLLSTGTPLKIQGETPSAFYEYTLNLSGKDQNMAANVIEERKIIKDSIATNHVVTTQIDKDHKLFDDPLKLEIKTYLHPFTGQRVLAMANLVLTDDQMGYLNRKDPRVRAKSVSGDLGLATFDLGSPLGDVSYQLTWNEEGQILATRKSLAHLMEFAESALHIVLDNGEVLLPVSQIEERFFLKGKNLNSLTQLMSLLGTPLFNSGAELIEVVVSGDGSLRLNEAINLNQFIPLTELNLANPAVIAIRDALYGPEYQASHGTLRSTGLEMYTPNEPIFAPFTQGITFLPGEILTPSIKTIRQITDAAYRIETASGTKKGLAFVEDSPYEYEFLAPGSGIAIRVPVLWEPSRAKNPWVLDKSRQVLVYRENHHPSTAIPLDDSHFIWVDNGGEWQFFFLDPNGDQAKRFQINFVPNPRAPLFLGAGNIINSERKSPNTYKKEVLEKASSQRDGVVAYVLKETQTTEEYFQFDRQSIHKGQKNDLSFRFLSTNLAERRWAILKGIQWDPENKRLVFDGPVQLLVKKSPDDEKNSQELDLYPVKVKQGTHEVIYLVEAQKNGVLKGLVFEWFVNEGLIGVKMALEHKVSEEEFLRLLSAHDIPLLRPQDQQGYKPVSRWFQAFAIHHIDEKIPKLPQQYRGFGYPDPALIQRISDETQIKLLLDAIDESYLYPTEETLFSQALIGDKDNEKMIYYGRDMIVEVPMELSGMRYVPSRQTNPNERLKNVRILIRHPNDAKKWFDIPVFAHPHRSSGSDPVIRFLAGLNQSPIALVQQFTKQVIGSRSVSGLKVYTKNLEPDTNTRSRAYLNDYLEFMDMDDKAQPIHPINFSLAKPVELPDGRILGLSIVKRGVKYFLEGVEFTQTPNGDDVSFVKVSHRKKSENGVFSLFRAAHGSPLYYLKDKDGKFLLMALDDNGKPMFWDRKDGIKDFPMADRSFFEMVGLQEQPYTSEATSTAVRLVLSKNEHGTTYGITAPLGREQGSSETSALFEATSKAIIRFKVTITSDGSISFDPQAQIKKKGRNEKWNEATLETFTDATGILRVYLKREREDGHHDYAWIKFDSAENLIGESFKVATAHYNRTNWATKSVMPSDNAFMSTLFGAAQVYPAYAALAEVLQDDERQTLEAVLGRNQEGYTLVAGFAQTMGFEPTHPHWHLILSSILHAHNGKRKEIELFEWPKGIRQKVIQLQELLLPHPILKKAVLLARHTAPMSLEDIKEFLTTGQQLQDENEILATLIDEFTIWMNALDDFHAAQQFIAINAIEPAYNRAKRAFHLFEIIEDTENLRKVSEWISQHYPEKSDAPLSSRRLEPRVQIISHTDLTTPSVAIKPTTSSVTPSTEGTSPMAMPDLTTEVVPFLPGCKNFPSWLRLPLYEWMKKLTSDKGAIVTDSPYPDSHWNYQGRIQFFSLQLGSIYWQRKIQDTPQLLIRFTRVQISQLMDTISKLVVCNDKQFESLEKKAALGRDLFELFKVLGLWIPRVQRYVQEAHSVNSDKILFGDFSAAANIDELVSKMTDYLTTAFKMKDAFQETQTPYALAKAREAQGLKMTDDRPRGRPKKYEYETPTTTGTQGQIIPTTTATTQSLPPSIDKGPKALLGNPAILDPLISGSEAPIEGVACFGNLALKTDVQTNISTQSKPKLRLVSDDDSHQEDTHLQLQIGVASNDNTEIDTLFDNPAILTSPLSTLPHMALTNNVLPLFKY